MPARVYSQLVFFMMNTRKMITYNVKSWLFLIYVNKGDEMRIFSL